MFFAQLAPQLPQLPEGPSLDRIRGPVDVPAFAPWQIAVIVAFLCIVLILLIWILVAYLRRRSQHCTPIPPDVAALAELDTAAANTPNDPEQFTVRSSLAVRRYFEEGVGIPAFGRTTEEFLRSLEKHPRLDAEARASLARCLELCDRVKFARHGLTPADREALTRDAKALILRVHKQKETARP